MANRYIDKYYDHDFLLELSKGIAKDDGNGISIKNVIDKHQIEFSHDRALVEKATRIGPQFDLRYAGAAYKIKHNAAGVSELLVHCVDRTIFADGVKVKNLKNSNGHITFHTDKDYIFNITFDVVVGQGVTVPLSEWSFSGHIQLANKSWPVNGTRSFPWEELVLDTENERERSHAEEARDILALKCLPVALDLVKNPSSIPVLDDSLAETTPNVPSSPAVWDEESGIVFVDGPPSIPKDGPVRPRKKSAFRQSAIVEHVVNMTPGMVSLCTTAGLAAAFGGPVGAIGSVASLIIGYAGNTIITKVRKGSQKKVSQELKNIHNLLTDSEMKEMSIKAVEEVIYSKEGGDKLTKEEVVIEAKEKFMDNAKDTIWAKNYQRLATKYDTLYMFGKPTFREGLNKGSEGWIAKNVPDRELETLLATGVESVKRDLSSSSSTTKRKAQLKLATKKLEKQRLAKLQEIKEAIKFQPNKSRDEVEKRINDLDREFKKGIEEIEKLTKQDTLEALHRAAAAEKRLHEKMEKLEKLHEEHLGARERGHGH